jgi:hypothetical protein
MRNLIKSIIIIFFIMLLLIPVFSFLLKPMLATWGATAKEISMPMAGDKKNLVIASTRAILIDAPKSEVWKWLTQLGADRCGFYSYTFIEEAMGYKTRYQCTHYKSKFNGLRAGNIIRGSINKKSSIIPYNFKVLYVKSGDTLVLQNWGTLLLEKVSKQRTRLIIRTQHPKDSSLWARAAEFFIFPSHYIMERRMLIGIKMRAEHNNNAYLTATEDVLWFAGVTATWLLICFLVFIGRGVARSVVVPAIFSVAWLLVVFLLNPIPIYSLVLLLSACLSILAMGLEKIKSQRG